MMPAYLKTGLHSTKPSWIVAYTRSRAEKLVDLELREKGITSYLPIVKTLRKWSDRKKWVEAPLFRSYVFLNVNEKEYFKAVSTTGVVRFVTNCGKPLTITDEEIELIKHSVNYSTTVVEAKQVYAKGTRVRILAGSLIGVCGILTEYRGKYRVAIMIESLGCALLVEVRADNIEKE